MKTAVAYFRTSSATNVGGDKDSLPRQQDAVRAYAAANGLEIVHEYYDPAVSGADALDCREEFRKMLEYMRGNGARIVLVENASRFARDLIVQETGYQMLKSKGIILIAVDSPESFVSDTPTAVFIRQVLGAVSQLEKTMLVTKLRGARDRKSAKSGRRCEGAPRIIPQAHAEAAQAAHGMGLTLRAVAAELASQGFTSRSGRLYSPQSVKHLLSRVS